MIYMISLEDGRLFVATSENLHRVQEDLSQYCGEDGMNTDGPYDFVEISQRLNYDPQTF